MLVRDPIERLVSRWNDDQGIRSQHELLPESAEHPTNPRLDAWVNSEGDGLSSYHNMLTALLQYYEPHQIVILLSEQQAYHDEEDCIAVLNELHRWLGLPPKNECIMQKVNERQLKQAYARPSPAALARAVEFWRPRNEAFFRLIGRNLTWVNFS